MKGSIGLNEALILSALEGGEALSVADVAQRFDAANVGRTVDDGSIYLALHRMTQRGLVNREARVATSADRKQREIGYYKIAAEGLRAIKEFGRSVDAMPRLARGRA